MSSALPEEALLPPLPLPLMLPERPTSLSWRDRSSFQASNSAVTCRSSPQSQRYLLTLNKRGLSYLYCVLLKYAQLEKDVQLDFAFVEQFLHLTLGLVQLL